jgi:uncharacterized protein (DUF2236 family)
MWSGNTPEEATVKANWDSDTLTRLRQRTNAGIRRTVGLTSEPPPRCDDPDEAYFPVDGIARIVHGDLASMIIGGLGSLFFQMLHPYTMAGVAQHSRYQDDPLGRLLQTANFIGYTTYGSKATAYMSIERVLAVHQPVRGVADDGVTYYANDPNLLAWVHAAEMSMFLTSYRRFGRLRLSDHDADRYVYEMASLARDLGIVDPPTSVAELEATIDNFRPELRLSSDGATARDFVANGLVKSPRQKLAYWLLVQSSFALLTPWEHELLGVATKKWSNRLLVQPATLTLCRILRYFVPPTKRQFVSDSPPSTTTT